MMADFIASTALSSLLCSVRVRAGARVRFPYSDAASRFSMDAVHREFATRWHGYGLTLINREIGRQLRQQRGCIADFHCHRRITWGMGIDWAEWCLAISSLLSGKDFYLHQRARRILSPTRRA